MTAYPKFVDLFGWIVVCLAVGLGLVSVGGIVAVFHASSQAALEQAQQQLHEVYYVIQPGRSAVIPFALCFLLACGVGYLGYSVTKKSVEYRISKVEQ
jgi:hypothetical protein